MAAEITVTNALQARLSRYCLVEPQKKSIFWQLMGREGSDASVRSPGVQIGGYQGAGARDKEHLEFKMRHRNHISPVPIPSGATMKDNYEEFEYNVVTGQREIFSKTLATSAFAESQIDRDILRDATEELRGFVEQTPYDAQFCHALSPARATLAGKSVVTYNSASSLWYALRTGTLASITTTLDRANIGYPRGWDHAPASDTNVRVAFLSKTAKDILAEPNGSWSAPGDDMAPTVANTHGYLRYLRRQNYRPPTWTLWGQKHTGFITLVEPNYFYELSLDSRFEDIQNWIEPRGPSNTVLEGMPRLLRLHGMYFAELQQEHALFENGTPIFSVNYGTADRAAYLGITLTANSYMSSMYEKPTFTRYEADHPGYAPQVGVYVIIGSKILPDRLALTPEGTTVTRDRVCFMVYTARRGN